MNASAAPAPAAAVADAVLAVIAAAVDVKEVGHYGSASCMWALPEHVLVYILLLCTVHFTDASCLVIPISKHMLCKSHTHLLQQ